MMVYKGILYVICRLGAHHINIYAINFYGKLHWMMQRVWNQSRKTPRSVTALLIVVTPWAVDIRHLEILEPGNSGKNKYPLTLLSLMFINYTTEE